MALGKSKAKNTQRDNSVNMDQLQRDNPKQTFGDVYENSQTMMNDMVGGIMDPFMDLIARGEETMSNNIMLPIMEALGIQAVGGGGDGGGGGDQTLDPYEARIQELMTNRGMSRDQAVKNQAGAMAAGGDINDNGAITNDEWARKLGSDFDNDGNVTNQEFAQWKEQNPNHQAAGGTQYKGLPGENGLFGGQQTPQQQQQAPQQPMGQPQAGVMPAPPMQQQQQPQPGMQQTGQTGQPQTRPTGISPEAQAAIAKWNQQGGGYV
jgi:hypothetical protein